MRDQPQRTFFAALSVLAAVVIPSAALADATKADQDRAEVLFQDGKTLMAEKRYAEACPKLQESQRIDPATGTLLALAICHEGQGRLASAHREFKRALPAVQLDRRRDREALVTTRLKELAPRVSKVVVAVEAAAAADTTLMVQMDGEPIARAAWGTELPVDAGEHVIEATGRGKPRRASVMIPGERALRRVTVPALESEGSSTEVATTPAQRAADLPGPHMHVAEPLVRFRSSTSTRSAS